MKQLGSEEYSVRQVAFDKLKTAGGLVVEPIEKAAKESDDAEVRNNAKSLLPYVRAALLCQAWQAAMQEKWIPGLKEGRINGPTLGWSPELDMQIIKVTSPGMEAGSEAFRGWLARNKDFDTTNSALRIGQTACRVVYGRAVHRGRKHSPTSVCWSMYLHCASKVRGTGDSESKGQHIHPKASFRFGNTTSALLFESRF